jgi:AraC-like DNA-binding protein
MERNHLTYDIPAVVNLPFRITNLRIHPEQEQLLTINLPQAFLGLYLNVGTAFEYTGTKTTPGAFQRNQFNFLYAPSGEYQIMLPAGLHHSIALQLPWDETERWSEDIPALDRFLKTLNLNKSTALSRQRNYLSPRLKSEIDLLLYNIWKDDQLGELFMAITSFNIFLQSLSEITNVSVIPSLPSGSFENKVIADAAKYLTDNLSSNITVEYLANQFNISRRNLQKGFQEHYGETVHEYILHRRMDKAKALLSEGNRSVKSIAALLGYKYVENFTTAYKKRFNQSPREARAL